VQRDTQWKFGNRVALKNVKTPEDLTEMIQQLNDVSDIVTSNFKRALTSTLDYHGFTAEQTDLYYELGALPSIVRSSMRFYMSLLIKLRQYALQCEGGWDQWKVHRTFHANKLISIRTLSNTRTNCMLRVYIYITEERPSACSRICLQSKPGVMPERQTSNFVPILDSASTIS